MARLPYLEADQVAPEYRDMLKRNTNLHKLLVNSPDMARAFNGIGGYIRFKSKLDPRLRELAILQVGWLEKSEYEFTHHVKIGKEFGVTDEDIRGLIAETEGKPSQLEPLAKAIVKGAREMVRELAMSDATFAEIKQELSDEHMTDLVLTIAFYCAVVRVLATMPIDNEPTYKEVLLQYLFIGGLVVDLQGGEHADDREIEGDGEHEIGHVLVREFLLDLGESCIRHRKLAHHFACAFHDRLGKRLKLGGLALGLGYQAPYILIGDAKLLADLHMMGEFVFRFLQPAHLKDSKFAQARVEFALEADVAADAVEGTRHVGRVDQELVQIGVALEHVAIFGRDLVGLKIGQAGHRVRSPPMK